MDDDLDVKRKPKSDEEINKKLDKERARIRKEQEEEAKKEPSYKAYERVKKQNYSCGGRVHKKAEGGMLKTPDNPGLKKLPESVRNNMGYMKKGGKVKKGYHRMPDGKVMKNSAHKKQSKCKRDGICVRGKTKGRMV